MIFSLIFHLRIRYGYSVEYRISGASMAAKYGAVAALVRSITPFSIESPHAGVMYYEDFDEDGKRQIFTTAEHDFIHPLG